MRIAIIGVGEVGGCYARAFAPLAEVALCDIKTDGPPQATAETLGVTLEPKPGPWLEGADFVLVCVPGKESPGVASAALPHIGAETIYVDMATGRPDDLRESAARFREAGRTFVDLAIMGGIQIWGEKAPVLLAGEAAGKAKALYEEFGAKTQIVGEGVPGDATSLKLLRSVFVKGLECLAIEALTAAEHMDVRPQLITVLQDIDDSPFPDFLEMLITTHIPHAARRRQEMVEAAEQLRAMGFDALVTGALLPRYDATLAAKERDAPAQGVRPMADSLSWLMGTVRR